VAPAIEIIQQGRAQMAKKYHFTDHPGHEARLGEYRDRWIANAMSTAAMTEADRDACRKAVGGLYEAANLKPPPAERIVFVSSPLIMRFAGGFAAAIWHARKSGQRDATWDATGDATGDATWAATGAATWAATEAATEAATMAATWDATSKNGKSWHTADIEIMRAVADAIGVGRLGLMCAENAYRMWDGGNQWSGYPAYLSFFREVAQLPLDYSKWDHYQILAERSGPRIMHAEFCIISDRPEVLLVDDQNRPHCDDGPFCRWRDGFSLYSIHGVRVSQQVVEAPETLTFEDVQNEPNAEVRRHMLERFGGLYDPEGRKGPALQAWLKAGNLSPISREDITGKMQPSGLSIWRMSNGEAPVTCDLYRAELPDDEPLHLLTVVCTSTAKVVPLRVPPTIFDAAEARAWTFRGARLADAVET